MNSSQLHYPVHSSSGNEIHWWRWQSENVDRWKAFVHGGRELLHGFPPLPRSSLEAVEDPSPEDSDYGNKADIKPEPEEEWLWELNPLKTSIDKLDFNNTANDVGEWYINENLDLAYLSALASNFVPSDTSTGVDSDPLFTIDVLTSLHVAVRSSFMVHEKTNDAQGAFFEVPAKHKDQKSILFGRFESEPMTHEISEDDFESPQFSHYKWNSHCIMKNMDTTLPRGLA